MVQSINIKYPFQESDKGFFIGMNRTDKEAIKSDLMHLLLTQKGERFYNPEFGTNLMKYIFEPNDEFTFGDLKRELNDEIQIYLPEVILNNVKLTEDEGENEYMVKLKIEYTVTDGTFKSKDFIELNI